MPASGVSILLALAALLLGTLVYLLDRDWATVQFLAPLSPWQSGVAGWFGSAGGVLPSFLHAFGISVLLVAACSPWRGLRPWICAGWFLFAAGLECLQAESMARLMFAGSGSSADGLVILALRDYAVLGRFDTNDLVALALGCIAAYAATARLGRHSWQRNGKH